MYLTDRVASPVRALTQWEEEEALGLALVNVAERKWPGVPLGSYYVEYNGQLYDYNLNDSAISPADQYGFDVYAYEDGLGGFIGSIGRVFKKVTKAVRRVMPKFLRKIKLHEVGGFLNPIRLAKMIGRPKDIRLIDFIPGARLFSKKFRTKHGTTIMIAAAIIGAAVTAGALAPALLPLLAAKLVAAGKIVGAVVGAAGPFIGKFLGKMGSKQQGQAIEQMTPEQIATYEQGGPLPPEMQALLDQAQRPTTPRYPPPVFSVPPDPSYGDLVGERGFTKAGMSTTNMFLIGSMAVGGILLLTGQGPERPRYNNGIRKTSRRRRY